MGENRINRVKLTSAEIDEINNLYDCPRKEIKIEKFPIQINAENFEQLHEDFKKIGDALKPHFQFINKLFEVRKNNYITRIETRHREYLFTDPIIDPDVPRTLQPNSTRALEILVEAIEKGGYAVPKQMILKSVLSGLMAEFEHDQKKFVVFPFGVYEIEKDLLARQRARILEFQKGIDDLRSKIQKKYLGKHQLIKVNLERFLTNFQSRSDFPPPASVEWKSTQDELMKKFRKEFERLSALKSEVFAQLVNKRQVTYHALVKNRDGVKWKIEATLTNSEDIRLIVGLRNAKGVFVRHYHINVNHPGTRTENHKGTNNSLLKTEYYLDNKIIEIYYFGRDKTIKKMEVYDPKSGKMSYYALNKSKVEILKGDKRSEYNEQKTYYCDSSGKAVMYLAKHSRVVIAGQRRARRQTYVLPSTFGFIHSDNNRSKEFCDYQTELKRRDGKLTIEEYMKEFKMAIRTKEHFSIFEQSILPWLSSMPAKLQKEIRIYGKKVCGIDARIAMMKRRYGFCVDTEMSLWVLKNRFAKWVINLISKVGGYGGFSKLEPLTSKEIDDFLDIIDSNLRMYPPNMLKRHPLERLYLLNIHGTRHAALVVPYYFNWIFLSGTLSNGGTVYVNKMIHHEFFHHFDFNSGFNHPNFPYINPYGRHLIDTYPKNPIMSAQEWGMRVYGSGYEWFYNRLGSKPDLDFNRTTPETFGRLNEIQKYFYIDIAMYGIKKFGHQSGYNKAMIGYLAVILEDKNIMKNMLARKRIYNKHFFDFYRDTHDQNRQLFEKIGREMLDKLIPGFNTPYALWVKTMKVKIGEDRATIAQELFTSVSYNALMKRASSDSHLEIKTRLIKDYYYLLSFGKMDDKYWDDISKGAVIDERYWNEREIKAKSNSGEYVRIQRLDRKMKGLQKLLSRLPK